jgi:uncharacterized protein YoxC
MERESAKNLVTEELNRLRKVNEQMTKDMLAISDETDKAMAKQKEQSMDMLRELALVHKGLMESVQGEQSTEDEGTVGVA